jgi:hypothetical protein
MKNINKNFNQIKNLKTPGHHLALTTLFALAMILPPGASAQSVVPGGQAGNPQGNEASMYQESYQQEIVTPYQRESFQQNQFSYGIPSSRRPAFNNFYSAEERAYRSQEEMRLEEEFGLQMEMMEAELKQRQQNFLLSQQAAEMEGNAGNDGGAFGGFIDPKPPIIVDNNNNTKVIIQLGEDNEKNLTQSGEDNEMGLLQAGKNNKGNIDQQGSKNKGAIVQTGKDNSASIRQSGSGNSASIRQSGSGNSATIDLGN